MPEAKYLSAPVPSPTLPHGIPYIVGNEAAERFSFYGMKTILFVFMTQYLMASSGSGRDVMSNDQAREYVHWFVASAYFFPIIGAIVSDAFLGKYRTILWLSIVYCLGHLCLAIDDTRFWLFSGLTLIAVGTGAIKPCVSAHVGDQFGKQNQHLLSKVFGWFYFAINLGAFASTLLTPLLLRMYGPRLAFGVPGILMFMATIVFWMGRNKFIHVPPGGMGSVREAFSGEGLRAIRNLVVIYVFVAMFWSLFDQTGSAWIQQSRRMDRNWMGVDWLPSQVQAANPILILLFIPLFSYIIYPAINRVFPLTPLRKVSIGFFVTIPAFAVPALIDTQITGGEVLSVTSEADMEVWPVERLFDGKSDGTGWISAQSPKFPQEIVVRLRERRAWSISSVSINPYCDLNEFLKSQEKLSSATAGSESCFAKDVEVFVGDSRKGPWKSVARIRLKPEDALQTVAFDPVYAEYMKLEIANPDGGDFVCLGEVEINAAGTAPAVAQSDAAEVWPNVAATGYKPNIVWQLLAYVLLTAAEIMISITCLEFSYTQAPNKMKSFIMALYLLSVSAGNAFTAGVNSFIQNPDGGSKLEGPSYYWFFTGLIALAAVGFIVVAKTYRGQTYIQEESES